MRRVSRYVPVLVDCKKDGFLIDLNFIEDKLKDSKIKAIIPMHYGGEQNNMSNIFSIANKYGLFVLEDATHSLENSIFNSNYNYHDHAIAFSFYANKNITSGGEGGALATNNKYLAKKVKNFHFMALQKMVGIDLKILGSGNMILLTWDISII